jgi:hypothetical protein
MLRVCQAASAPTVSVRTACSPDKVDQVPPTVFPTEATTHHVTPCVPVLSSTRGHRRGEVLFLLCTNSLFPIMPLYSSTLATPCYHKAVEQKPSPGLHPHAPSSHSSHAPNPNRRPPHGRPASFAFPVVKASSWAASVGNSLAQLTPPRAPTKLWPPPHPSIVSLDCSSG